MESLSDVSNYDFALKILLIGDSAVGKTSLLRRYSHPDKPVPLNMLPTIGVDFRIVNQVISGKRVRLQIWDTAGQERFRSITNGYFRGAQGVLLVYDISNRVSFNRVRQWMADVKLRCNSDVTVVLVANKADVGDSGRKPLGPIKWHRSWSGQTNQTSTTTNICNGKQASPSAEMADGTDSDNGSSSSREGGGGSGGARKTIGWREGMIGSAFGASPTGSTVSSNGSSRSLTGTVGAGTCTAGSTAKHHHHNYLPRSTPNMTDNDTDSETGESGGDGGSNSSGTTSASSTAAVKENVQLRVVSREEGQMLAAEYGIPFFEVSAKTGEKVNDVFLCCAREVVKQLHDLDLYTSPNRFRRGSGGSAVVGGGGSETDKFRLSLSSLRGLGSSIRSGDENARRRCC